MLIFEYLLLIIILFLFVFFVSQFYNIIFKGYAPFISTKKKYIDKIIENIEITDNSIIYELGCGNAGFLKKIRYKNKKSKLFGIENSFLIYINSQIQNAFYKLNIIFQKKNLFKVNLENANIIYCYLNNKIMSDLRDKFLNECKNGTKIISYQFPIPNLEPYKEIELKPNHRLIFYEIKK